MKKLCFSTIGSPDWSLKDIISTAKDLGYRAIEVRSIANEIYAPKMKEFTKDLSKTKDLIADSGIKIAMLSSNVALANHQDVTALKRAEEYLKLAEKMDVPFIRVMSTDKPYFDGGDEELCLKQFEEIVKMANDTKVTVLMETNGIFVDTKKLGIFLDQVKGNSGALWDTHHPYRFNDEQLSTSIKNLGSKITYVHLKDSVINKGKVAYKIMGTGDMPIKNIVSLLQENNYDGYYTLEWVKLWDDTLEDAGIVFAQYVQYMNRLP